ncbi:hypothetical protein BU24DRAFT_84480 [Aaosphaeria arxii CBS 175.79]|uniref:Uncharacterized protein n=1 Tax=Aaosphaeria arxii CBS 175.79 TaxID=1450172 RepID=A0A6A5X8C7_9PLEO|nr:uncharacterized protein BU24DRAFT_84480 [Aaosphaeria arxii CBS 175.79]KAF2009202.1 hypothetical protein BU24DRAFT_84480 [Aaosphaeria arxii CBS 175.79]
MCRSELCSEFIKPKGEILTGIDTHATGTPIHLVNASLRLPHSYGCGGASHLPSLNSNITSSSPPRPTIEPTKHPIRRPLTSFPNTTNLGPLAFAL